MLSRILSGVFGKNTKINHKRTKLKPWRTQLLLECLDERIAPAAGVTLQLFDAGSTPTVTLAINDFSFGGSDPSIRWNVYGGNPAKTEMDNLQVSIDMNSSSTALVGNVTSGRKFSRAVLNQQVTDQKGKDMTHTAWVMSDVYITSIRDRGTVEDSRPSELLSFSFEAVTVANSRGVMSYNIPQNSTKGPTVPSNIQFLKLEDTLSTSSLTLSLSPEAGGKPIEMNLDSFDFGAKNSNKLWVPGNKNQWKGDVTFDTLQVSTSKISNDYPALFGALIKGTRFKTATLTSSSQSKEGKFVPLATWVMGTVYLTGDTVQGGIGKKAPSESLSFDFGTVTVANKSSKTSWAQMTSTFMGPDLPMPQSTFGDPYLPKGGEPITLQLAGKNLPTVNLDVTSFGFGFANPASLSAKTGTLETGKVNFETLSISTNLNRYSPDLFKLLTSGGSFDTAILIQNVEVKTGKPQPVAAWNMGNIIVSRQTVSGVPDEVPTENFEFTFGSITHANKSAKQSWDQTTNKTGTNDLPANLTFGSLPGSTSPLLTLTLNGDKAITLNLSDFSFGAERSIASGGANGGTGKVGFQTLVVSNFLNDNSPNLFKALVSGSQFSTATLTLSVPDSRGEKSIPVNSWMLGSVVLSGDKVEGNRGDLPKETLSFNFVSATVANDKATGSWDLKSSKANGPVIPETSKYLASQVPSGTGKVSLQLEGQNLPTINLDVNSFDFGFGNAVTSEKGGLPRPGKVNFQTLSISTYLNRFSPDIFKNLTGGTTYNSATLIQRNSDQKGKLQPIAAWKMGTVRITKDQISGNNEERPAEKLEISFGSITQANKAAMQSWDLITSKAQGPDISAGLVTQAISPSGTSALTLTLEGATNQGKAIVLNLDSFQFGGFFPVSVAAKGAMETGKFSFQNLEVQTNYNDNTPFLFRTLVTGSPYKTVTLTKSRIGDKGVVTPLSSWVLGTAYLTSDLSSGNEDGLPSQALQFQFQSVTVANAIGIASWDQVQNKATGPAAPSLKYGAW